MCLYIELIHTGPVITIIMVSILFSFVFIYFNYIFNSLSLFSRLLDPKLLTQQTPVMFVFSFVNEATSQFVSK